MSISKLTWNWFSKHPFFLQFPRGSFLSSHSYLRQYIQKYIGQKPQLSSRPTWGIPLHWRSLQQSFSRQLRYKEMESKISPGLKPPCISGASINNGFIPKCKILAMVMSIARVTALRKAQSSEFLSQRRSSS